MARYIDVEKAKIFFEEIDAGSRAHGTLLTPYEFAEYLDEIPTVDVQEVRHGRWVNESRMTAYGPISAQCSVCELFSGTWLRNAPYKYCPHCGAKMGKE